MKEIDIFNLYFDDPDMSKIDDYEEAFLNNNPLNEILVEECSDLKNKRDFIEIVVPVNIFDYNIFDDLKKLLAKNISKDSLKNFEKEVFRNENVSPDVLKDLIDQLEPLAEKYYSDDKYYYLIYDEQYRDYSSPVRFEYNDKSCKYDIAHSTYRKKDKKHDFVEFYNYDDSEIIEWIPCEDGTILDHDKREYVVKKFFYRDIAAIRLQQLKIMADMAIENGFKLQKNNPDY